MKRVKGSTTQKLPLIIYLLHSPVADKNSFIREFIDDSARPFCPPACSYITLETILGAKSLDKPITSLALEFTRIIPKNYLDQMPVTDIGNVAYRFPNHCA
jgi:hypothetical protein